MEQDSPLLALQLYITGASPNSIRAVTNIKAICEKYFSNHYKLEIIDIYQQPGMAESGQVVAMPTLIRTNPLPVKRLIGDMSDTAKVLKGLDFEGEL